MTKIVAILNLTPDSFSDGGRYNTTSLAARKIDSLIEEGAEIIDIGAESTRPGAHALDVDEEWQRLAQILPAAIKRIHQFRRQVSIDSYKIPIMERCLDLGCDYLNDVKGSTDPKISKMLESYPNSRLITTYSTGVPANINCLDYSADAAIEAIKWAQNQISYFHECLKQIILDPGIGFNKLSHHSWQIINSIEKFKILGVPIFIGHSRKRFLGAKFSDRDLGTLAISQLIAPHVDYIRVHDIKAHRFLLKS